jgi:hypothetical protein
MPPNRHIPKKHWDTPSKAGLRATKEYLEVNRIQHTRRRLFNYFGMSHRTGNWILDGEDRRLHNSEFREEMRGRDLIFSEADIQKIEKLLYDGGYKARSLPWAALPNAAGVDFDDCGRTVRNALHQNWRKCVACTRAWTSPSHKKERKKAAFRAGVLRTTAEMWRNVRFSDETHFSYGPEGKHKVIRKPGERECPDCIQYRTGPEKDEQFRCHAWAAIGYNFKSDLIWYDAGNSNGAITQKVYRDQILEPVVKPWLERGDKFIVEEDRASGHGHANNCNPAWKWKEKHGLTWYINTAGSPDLTPIENAWKAPKAYLKEHAIWDEEAIVELAEEGWEALTIETINDWVDSMPQRMRDTSFFFLAVVFEFGYFLPCCYAYFRYRVMFPD